MTDSLRKAYRGKARHHARKHTFNYCDMSHGDTAVIDFLSLTLLTLRGSAQVASLGLVALVVQEDSSIVIREQPAPVNYAGADKEYPAGFFDEGKNSVGLDKLTGDGVSRSS